MWPIDRCRCSATAPPAARHERPRALTQDTLDSASRLLPSRAWSSVTASMAALFSTLPAALAPPTAWYFTCDPKFESSLISECARAGIADTSFIEPGLLRAPGLASTDDPLSHDYAYALQVLPSAAQIDASSIGALQRGVLDHVAQHDAELRGAARGALAVHSLVPDLLKGAPRPKARGLRRAEMLKAKLVSALRAQYAAARPAADGGELETERWLLQLMLLRPDCCLASLARVGHAELGTWPRADAEAGLADVDIAEDMPSSAYRKLLEALSCAGIEVDSSTTRASRTAVDLGAHPGGWTTALRRHGYGRVTAVDRQPLADRWLGGGVDFVQGDAFAFEPAEPPVALMASDVAAYPERVPELLERWCSRRWAEDIVVTMKFTGETPDFDTVDEARRVAAAHGYRVRAKHFFNNKNELEIMLRL